VIRTTNRKGVTLIELLIVVLILAALSAIAIPRISLSAQNAKQDACDTNIDVINSAIEMYAADNDGSYPTDDADMQTKVTGNADYFPDGLPICPTGLAGSYSMDATTKRVNCSIH
jgi:prepilin-type N-terminal cleavage/methylation domain-containing protein